MTHCIVAAGLKKFFHIANRTVVVVDHTDFALAAVDMVDHIAVADMEVGSQAAVMRHVLGEVGIELTEELARNNQSPGTEVVVMT